MDEWEMERCGHRLLPRGRHIPGIGVRREGRVMRGRGQGSSTGRSLTNAGRRPGCAEDRAGLGEFIKLSEDPCAWVS